MYKFFHISFYIDILLSLWNISRGACYRDWFTAEKVSFRDVSFSMDVKICSKRRGRFNYVAAFHFARLLNYSVKYDGLSLRSRRSCFTEDWPKKSNECKKSW